MYGGTPITGTEGVNWYIAGERARRVETLAGLHGIYRGSRRKPQGLDASNANGHTATTNKARTTVGKIANAISALNICDLVGMCGNGLMNFCTTQRRQVRHGMTFLAAAGVAYMYSALACTPSLAAAIGATACVAAPGRELQRLPVGRGHGRWRVVRV